MGDQVAVGGVGVVTKPLDHLGGMAVMQRLALAELGLHPPHVSNHPVMQRTVPAQLGIAVADHQAVFAGKMPLGGTQQLAQFAAAPPTTGSRDQPACQGQDPTMLPVDQGMAESGKVETHRAGRSLDRAADEPSSPPAAVEGAPESHVMPARHVDAHQDRDGTVGGAIRSAAVGRQHGVDDRPQLPGRLVDAPR